jgi:hypothetical protein
MEPMGVACIPNIGFGERRKRLRSGLVALGVGVVAAVALATAGIPPAWRLGLFVPFVIGTVGYFQARDKT